MIVDVNLRSAAMDWKRPYQATEPFMLTCSAVRWPAGVRVLGGLQ